MRKRISLFTPTTAQSNKKINLLPLCIYLYAVENLPISSVTQKILVTGHTENKADNMHLLIEKEKKEHYEVVPFTSRLSSRC